jgi:hypothetical protein
MPEINSYDREFEGAEPPHSRLTASNLNLLLLDVQVFDERILSERYSDIDRQHQSRIHRRRKNFPRFSNFRLNPCPDLHSEPSFNPRMLLDRNLGGNNHA